MLLHPDTIETVKQSIDIVDIVSEQVVLKKQGKDFVGLCPFHDDKSPSFTVSPSKQFYYCFSCGAGGNAIKFLMELNKSSFGDVVLQLAERYQVPVQTLEPEQQQEFQRSLSLREQLYEILAVTTKFYEHALRQPQGIQALEYLTQQRRLQEGTIQQFQLGYAPAGWSTLYGYLVEQKRYAVKLVEQAGLIVPRQAGSGYYDRFRDRLMIPIHDLQGRTIGFGGRTLTDENPKYLNSPETELFDKGKTLFGLDKARSDISKRDRAIVVEGYFDVIALHAVGITNAVAALGTAFSQAQVKQLLRYTDSKQIILNFDADVAGNKAAERTIGELEALAYQGQIQLRVMNLPGGKDADEYLQQASASDYRTLLDEAPLWLDWQIQQVLQGADLSQADQFQAVIQAIVKLLGNLPNTPLRTHYIHHCAELLGQGESRLVLQLEEDLRLQVRGQRWHGKSDRWAKPGDRSVRELAEAKLLRIYLHCPDYRAAIRQAFQQRDLNGAQGLADFKIRAHRILWLKLSTLEAEENTPLEQLDLLAIVQNMIAEFPPEIVNKLVSLLEPDEFTRLELERPSLGIRAAAATLERLESEKRCRHLLDSWQLQSIQSIERCMILLLAEDFAEDLDPSDRIEQLYEELNQEALHFQKLFYDERQYLQNLDRQRCTSQEDLVLLE
ncbi:MAG: DNA primase [Prochlorotrichaceae cyanobacterium]|jgi:DNA primase